VISSSKNLERREPATPLPESWLGVAGMLADSAFETDREGRFTAVSAGGVLGHPASLLIGRDMSELFGAPDGAFRVILDAICAEAVVWHGRIELTCADGSSGIYRLALAPKRDGDRDVSGAHGLLLDLGAPELGGGGNGFGFRVADLLDPDTGLWAAPSFIEQAARRFDRLDVEDKPGTLLFLGFARAPEHLHTAIAMRLTEELREIVRPTDLLGRIDRTTIALWCDGMDHLTGAERAARFCTHLPASLPERVLISVGLVTRWPGNADDPHSLIARAGIALGDAAAATEREAIGSWRVWQKDAA
jgi:GGDEF domain-containing protein